jgi:hypothetical protein
MTEYRPKVPLGFALAGIWVVTAMILVWVGVVLRPDDRAAMDGFTLILFTAIPIRLFSWTAAAFFAFFGFRVARRALRAEPTLVLSEANLTLPDGKVVPWSQVSAKVEKNGLLVIVVADPHSNRGSENILPKWRRWLARRLNDNQVALSSFDLGADPAVVAAALESRIPEATHDAI